MHEFVKYLFREIGFVVLIFVPLAILLIVMLFVPRENYTLVFSLFIIFGVVAIILIYDRVTHRPISYNEQVNAQN
jgi:hypothetical protein